MKRILLFTVLLLLSSFLYGCKANPNSSRDDNNVQGASAQASIEAPSDTEVKPEIVKIDVTSASLTDAGKWITAINSKHANPAGDNLSPQLTWSQVDEAGLYAVYMRDISANNWLHWKARNVQVTSLDMGEVLEGSNYVGPYPPSGTHEYEVIVYALKAAPDKFAGSFDTSNNDYKAVEEKLDTSGGQRGNIIGKGSISGTVTVGENVE